VFVLGDSWLVSVRRATPSHAPLPIFSTLLQPSARSEHAAEVLTAAEDGASQQGGPPAKKGELAAARKAEKAALKKAELQEKRLDQLRVKVSILQEQLKVLMQQMHNTVEASISLVERLSSALYLTAACRLRMASLVLCASLPAMAGFLSL
jgi:hypothetical protein